MKSFSQLKEYLVIDGEKFYHYGFGGKYTATKFIVWDGIHWYNSNRPYFEEKIKK